MTREKSSTAIDVGLKIIGCQSVCMASVGRYLLALRTVATNTQ